MTFTTLPTLSDRHLLTQLEQAVHQERQSTAHVVALLMEVDARKLYAQQSCSSLFTYCVQVLHFSEHAAYLRIEAARAARRVPAILPRLADGSLHLTVDRATYDKLRQVQDLLRHAVPTGDPAVIFDRALTLLVAELSKTKTGATDRPRTGRAANRDPRWRHIPAAVRREVWQRDGGQCAFRGEQGRCRETGWLEFHHVRAYARGGAATAENVELRCRTHNLYEAEQEFACTPSFHARESKADYTVRTRSGPSVL